MIIGEINLSTVTRGPANQVILETVTALVDLLEAGLVICQNEQDYETTKNREEILGRLVIIHDAAVTVFAIMSESVDIPVRKIGFLVERFRFLSNLFFQTIHKF